MKIYQSEDLHARQRTDRPTLAFATMCKNEEHIIQAKNLVKDLNIKNSFSITSNIGAV